jgi:UMF2 family putative MFS family transporter
MIWVVVESALMCSGTSRNRGRLLAAYMMVYYVGTVLGQLMVSKLSTELMHAALGGGVNTGGILPLLFTRIMEQRDESHGTTAIWPISPASGAAWR